MAAFQPFEAASGATAGKTVRLATGGTNSSVAAVVSTTGGAINPTMMVVNQGPNFAWVRLSTEAAPTATAADIPMLGNTTLFLANPAPTGACGVAVIVSVTTSANVIWFTPGEGGI